MPRFEKSLLAATLAVACFMPSAAFARGGRDGVRYLEDQQRQQDAAKKAADEQAAQEQAAENKVTDAQNALDKAIAKVHEIAAKLKATFDASPEEVAALKAQSDAYAKFNAVRAPILDHVHASTAYHSASVDHDAAVETVAQLNGSQTDPSPEQMAAAQQAVLDKATAMAKLESAALDASADYGKAKSDLAAATTVVQDLEHKFEQTVQNDPDWVAAKKAEDDARANVSTARTALASAGRTK